jgi:hypothetical protein
MPFEKLVASDAGTYDYFGTTVGLYSDATHGPTAIVGGPYNANLGAAYIFVLDEPPPPPSPPPSPPTPPTPSPSEPFSAPVVDAGGVKLDTYTPVVFEPGGYLPLWTAGTTSAGSYSGGGTFSMAPTGAEAEQTHAGPFEHGTEVAPTPHEIGPGAVLGAEIAEQLIDLHHFTPDQPPGKVLVFNLDEFHYTDLCTDSVVFPGGITGPVTGLYGYLEGIKAGKALVFNFDEITCLDLLS